MDKFGELTLIKQKENVISGVRPVRLYRSSEVDKHGIFKHYRYHLGFPEDMMKPICPMAETSPYMGEAHWKEEDGFWIWWTMAISTKEAVPYQELNQSLHMLIEGANNCLQWFRQHTQCRTEKTSMGVLPYDSEKRGGYTCEVCEKLAGRWVVTIEAKYGGNVLCTPCLNELANLISKARLSSGSTPTSIMK